MDLAGTRIGGRGCRLRHDAPTARQYPAFQIGQSVFMTKTGRGPDEFDDGALRALFAAIASRDDVEVTRMLDQTPGFATHPLQAGATRQDPHPYFLIPIRHHVYTGDTAL